MKIQLLSNPRENSSVFLGLPEELKSWITTSSIPIWDCGAEPLFQKGSHLMGWVRLVNFAGTRVFNRLVKYKG